VRVSAGNSSNSKHPDPSSALLLILADINPHRTVIESDRVAVAGKNMSTPNYIIILQLLYQIGTTKLQLLL
jgi:hypothetical protein